MNGAFAIGQRVRVLDLPSTGHVRTPRYVRGKRGVVERICGRFRRPEDLAYGRYDGPRETLYRIRFAQHDMWPGYRGAARDTLDVDVYEHWLAEDA